MSALLKDRRLRQGIFAWPAQNGIEEGLLAEWWSEMMLSKAGDDHRRLRRLGNPAFSRTLIERMVPEFQALANELVALQLGLRLTARAVAFPRAVVRELLQLLLLPLPS